MEGNKSISSLQFTDKQKDGIKETEKKKRKHCGNTNKNKGPSKKKIKNRANKVATPTDHCALGRDRNKTTTNDKKKRGKKVTNMKF